MHCTGDNLGDIDEILDEYRVDLLQQCAVAHLTAFIISPAHNFAVTAQGASMLIARYNLCDGDDVGHRRTLGVGGSGERHRQNQSQRDYHVVPNSIVHQIFLSYDLPPVLGAG